MGVLCGGQCTSAPRMTIVRKDPDAHYNRTDFVQNLQECCYRILMHLRRLEMLTCEGIGACYATHKYRQSSRPHPTMT